MEKEDMTHHKHAATNAFIIDYEKKASVGKQMIWLL